MVNSFSQLYRPVLIVVVALSIVAATSAEAVRSEGEREALSRAIQEIELLDAVLADAERRADKDSRIYFDYDQLRDDLTAVKQGISEYVAGDRLQPRDVAPFSASYSRTNAEE